MSEMHTFEDLNFTSKQFFLARPHKLESSLEDPMKLIERLMLFLLPLIHLNEILIMHACHVLLVLLVHLYFQVKTRKQRRPLGSSCQFSSR